MPLMCNEYKDRLKHWQRTLQQDFYLPLQQIDFEGFITMDQLTPEQAMQQSCMPIPEGFEWGHTWEYMWVRSTVVIPEEAAGKMIVMSLDLSGEATLFVNGKAFGTRRAEWVDVPHHYMVDNILTENAVPGEKFELLFEVYAGHFFPDAGACATGPVMPGTFTDPLTEGKRATVGHSSFGIWNEDAYQLWMDISTLEQLMLELPEDSLRAANIAEALETYTRIVDFEQPLAERSADYRRAREAIAPVMQAHNGTTAPVMSAVGNSHLDLAWLWPMQETERKTARTFAQQLRLLEKYPEYRYIQSQPAAYAMCRERYPELYERIRDSIRKGRWIADGAMYVEPDTNMPSGEALVRQLVHGKRFYRDELGVDSRVLWLPDTFGYTAALPQILKKCHVDYLVTQKIFWSYNDGDRFPYHYFNWVGMDGSKVVSFLPTSYTYRTDPSELASVWRSRVQKRDLSDFIFPFGYGDGGGGPCRDHIEYAIRQKDLEGSPRVTMESPIDFFTRMDASGGPVNTWTGELYFNAHRGTYTVQANVKKNNRLSEIALHEMELWGSAAMLQGKEYPAEAADRLWKSLLLHQFHDILPGSSIGRVYKEANANHLKLQTEANELASVGKAVLIKDSEGLTVFNSLGFERNEVIDLPASYDGAVTADGKPVPVFGGKAVVTVPSLGSITLLPGQSVKADVSTAMQEDDHFILENAFVRIVLNKLGEIISYRAADGREYASAPMNHLRMFKDVPRKFDAWDIDSNYTAMEIDLPSDSESEILCAEGLTASIRVKRSLGQSTVEQIISLNAIDNTVLFETTVDWHELHRLLKADFPTSVMAENAYHEMQFGYVERPTHRSRAYDKDRFEVCNHRYTALSDNAHGCAVLNNCKYGVSAEGSSIGLTLLRAASSPELPSDNGVHHFIYAFEAWNTPFGQSTVVMDGMRLNVPLTVMEGTAESFSLFSVDSNNVMIDTVKPAEDGSGDLILRIYESQKKDTVFTLSSDITVAASSLCDMLEQPESVIDLSKPIHIKPFEILTVRITAK